MQTFNFFLSHTIYITNNENSIQTNINSFWKYVNSPKKTNSILLGCVKYDNSSSSNISETVQLFANYISSVYVSDLMNLMENPNQFQMLLYLIILILISAFGLLIIMKFMNFKIN